MADKNPSFAVRPGDPKDVSWGLATADTCWKRGDRAEALKWLRRAVEAASEAELDDRYLELAKIAADLTTQIGSIAPGPMAPSPSVAPPGLVTTPRAPLVAQRPAAKAPAPVAARVPSTKDAPKKSERKSVTNEASRPRTAHEAKGHEKVDPNLGKTQEEAPRKRSNSRADRGEAQRRQSRTDEIDAWPTETLAGTAVPAELTAPSEPQEGPPTPRAVGAVLASQAVRVLVWREANGSVQVAAIGSTRATPANAIEATLSALEPGADLVELLS
jgi:hypothetical protein